MIDENIIKKAIEQGRWLTVRETITEVETNFYRHVFSCCGHMFEWYTKADHFIYTPFGVRIDDHDSVLFPQDDLFSEDKHPLDMRIVVPNGELFDIVSLWYGESSEKQPSDMVNHPSHYAWLKDLCGVEPIDICRQFDFNVGNALKYLMRKGKKDGDMTDKEKRLEDLRKAVFYLNDEIALLSGENGTK